MTRFQEGDWVHIEHHGPHFAVVLRIRSERAIVLYGTSRERNIERVEVLPQLADGIRLSLTWPTYFYPANCIPMPLAKLKPKGRRCPPRLLASLHLLCQRQLGEMGSMNDAQLDALAEEMAERGIKPR